MTDFTTRAAIARHSRRTVLGAGAATAPLLMLPRRSLAQPGMEALLNAMVQRNDVPFVVAMWADSAGIRWQGAAGYAREATPASAETLFRIFSMTKAIGSTAAMLLVDRGKLSLDTPVADVLPAYRELPVLDGFDGLGKPRLRAQARVATVRHLATHTSGLAYEFWNADVGRAVEALAKPPLLTGQRAALDYPLAFDAGMRWDYGPGIDWLGMMVEAVDGRRIDQFCRDELFEPLGMNDTVFEVPERLADRLATLRARGEDGRFAPFELAPPPQPEVYGMGHALYSTAPDYLRFLRMVLRRGELDGQRVLSEAAVETLLSNQIGDLRIPVMHTTVPPITASVDLFPYTPKTHSFGFVRYEQGVPGMRSAGSQSWAGVCNTHFWFDPAKDMAAVFMTQSLPFVEPRFLRAYTAFERAVYAG